MLSPGTRIGLYRVNNWMKEGSCGQSYNVEGYSGEDLGETRYLKLFHRVISENDGFSDFFSQECLAIQQVQGRGIWPLLSYGVSKWKHWMVYSWFEGAKKEVSSENEDAPSKEVYLRSLDDLAGYFPHLITPKVLRDILIDLHCGLHHAHGFGVIHGNVKPSNVLIDLKENGDCSAWLTEFALPKITNFESPSKRSEDYTEFVSQNLQFQESLKQSHSFRIDGSVSGGLPEEKEDIFALGALVRFILNRVGRTDDVWSDWNEWSRKSINLGFENISQSLAAIPGVGDLSDYGISGETESAEETQSAEEIRIAREIEWERQQRASSIAFRRNLTGLIGCICILIFLFSKIYLFLNPSPWMEYSVEGASDRYQLGFGVWSGKAWGILPSAYDENGRGGQDVAGEWIREDGLFRLDFRKFKKSNEEESGKKLWQFIGKGATSNDDYFIWSDFLKYNTENRTLRLIKRVHENEIYIPGEKRGEPPRLFPEVRIRRSEGTIQETQLVFAQAEPEGRSWSFWIGFGFLISCLLYHRMLNRINLGNPELGKD
jgi:serine/threonine protein kinase